MRSQRARAHGAQGAPRRTRRTRPERETGRKRTGSPGPKIATSGVSTAAAKWIAPVSFDIKRSSRLSRAGNPAGEVRPAATANRHADG